MSSKGKGVLAAKTAVFFGVLALLAAVQIGAVRSHSPSSMNLSYDRDTNELTVRITHTVENPNDHYVERVEVRKNGSVVDNSYTSQPSANTFTYTYNVSATTEDSITATAYCNRFGDISDTLDFEDGNGDGGTNWNLIGGIVIVLLAVVVIFMLYYWRGS